MFHVGDGNLHPLILYDANVPGEMEAAEHLGHDILRLCVSVGGVLTGEHGVGTEKRDLMPEMFTDLDMRQQQRLKCAFDPGQHLNPGKVFPTLHRCAELGAMHIHKGENGRFPNCRGSRIAYNYKYCRNPMIVRLGYYRTVIRRAVKGVSRTAPFLVLNFGLCSAAKRGLIGA